MRLTEFSNEVFAVAKFDHWETKFPWFRVLLGIIQHWAKEAIRDRCALGVCTPAETMLSKPNVVELTAGVLGFRPTDRYHGSENSLQELYQWRLFVIEKRSWWSRPRNRFFSWLPRVCRREGFFVAEADGQYGRFVNGPMPGSKGYVPRLEVEGVSIFTLLSKFKPELVEGIVLAGVQQFTREGVNTTASGNIQLHFLRIPKEGLPALMARYQASLSDKALVAG